MDDAEVWRGIFDAEYESLQREAERLARIERTPENFDEIAAASARLDERRRQSRIARRQIVSRYEPATPDIVDVPRGTVDTGRTSKTLATLTAVMFAAVAWMGFQVVRNFLRPFPVTIEGATNHAVEPDGSRCRWQFDLLVENGYDEPIVVHRVLMVVDRGSRPAVLIEPVEVPPQSIGGVPVSFGVDASPGVSSSRECPDHEAIDHGLVTVEFSGGFEVRDPDAAPSTSTAEITGRF